MPGKVISVNLSSRKGEKRPTGCPRSLLQPDAGWTGTRTRVASAKSACSRKSRLIKGVSRGVELEPGDFGENITTEGIDLTSLRIGQRLLLGDSLLQISHIGKICQSPCSIGKRLGDCLMPREGLFARVVRGGRIVAGDSVEQTTIKAAAVLTSSDRCSRGERTDTSGPFLVGLLDELGASLTEHAVLPDEEAELISKMRYLADRCGVDLILSTGGTGFSPRDRTPDATLAVIDSPAGGIAEAIRYRGSAPHPECLPFARGQRLARQDAYHRPSRQHPSDRAKPALSFARSFLTRWN